MAERFSFVAERGFHIWSSVVDVSLILNFYEIQRVVQAGLERDGEALVVARQAQQILGHADIRTTEIYTHTRVEDQERLQRCHQGKERKRKIWE